MNQNIKKNLKKISSVLKKWLTKYDDISTAHMLIRGIVSALIVVAAAGAVAYGSYYLDYVRSGVENTGELIAWLSAILAGAVGVIGFLLIFGELYTRCRKLTVWNYGFGASAAFLFLFVAFYTLPGIVVFAAVIGLVALIYNIFEVISHIKNAVSIRKGGYYA